MKRDSNNNNHHILNMIQSKTYLDWALVQMREKQQQQQLYQRQQEQQQQEDNTTEMRLSLT